MMRSILLCCAAAFALSCTPAHAQTATSGTVNQLQSYYGHSGTLVNLSGTMLNPNGCISSGWYIYPDSAPRAQFGQALLLSLYMADKTVNLVIDGCYENFPKIVVITAP